jgi:hypothetical protein
MKLLCLAIVIVTLTLAPDAATAASTSGVSSAPSPGSAPTSTDPKAQRSTYEKEIRALETKNSQMEQAIAKNKQRILALKAKIRQLGQ